MLVVDGALARATVVDRDLRAIRTIALPFPTSPVAVVSWPDSVVAGGLARTPELVGLPLHLLSLREARAVVGLSFSEDDGEARPGVLKSQVLTSAPGGGFWSGDEGKYRLTLWKRPGNPERTLRREVEWFPDGSASLGTPKRAPDAAMTDVQVDNKGYLWVVSRIPSSIWSTAWPTQTVGRGEYQLSKVIVPAMFDSMVEVIDLRTNRVLASSRMPQWIVSILPGQRLAAVRVDDDGAISVEILQALFTP
jgi:hypothetical protein